MRRPRILDLYCGQGGASTGYYLAGFDVIGVDIKPQAQYPFPMICRDGLSALLDDGLVSEIDAVHVSSPSSRSESTLALLGDLDIPWVAETIDKTPGSIILCGTHFNLGASGRVLKRHRRFSASFRLPDPGPCWCSDKPAGGVYGHQGYVFKADEAREAMGIDWMSRQGLAKAIPPDYTRWIGEQLARHHFPQLGSRDHLHERYSSGRSEQFVKV